MRGLKKALLVLLVVFLGLGLWSLFQNSRASGDFLVVIDPGHGGGAPGAVYEDVMEKDLNLAVALMVRDLLAQEEGIQVQMTRETDVDVDLYERSGQANDAKADLFVSIHSNALEGDSSFEGILTFYHRDNGGGEDLARLIQQAVSRQSGGKDLGIRHEDYVVVRETKAPACLLEMGFMTSPAELARLQDTEYQSKIAQGILLGILDYRKNQ